MKKILLMLCVLACVTGCNKNTEIEESKVIENQPEVVQENVEKEVKNESKQETEKNIDNKYERVTSIPDEANIVFIDSIEKYGEDYLIKCQSYDLYTIDKEEVEDKFKNNEKIYIYGKEYDIVKEDEDFYLLARGDLAGEYFIYKGWDENNRLAIHSASQIGDVWKLNDKQFEIIVDKDAQVLIYDEPKHYEGTSTYVSIEEFYNNNKDIKKIAQDAYPDENVYDGFLFKDNKCISFGEVLTTI